MSPDSTFDGDIPRRVLFQPFTWFDREDTKTIEGWRAAKLASTTLDLARGVAAVLRLAERDELDGACSEEGTNGEPIPALLRASDHGDLQRMSIVAMELLAEQASDFMDRLRQQQERHAPT